MPDDKTRGLASRGPTGAPKIVSVFEHLPSKILERFSAQGQYVKVTEASLTYVAIDRDGRPRPIERDGLPPGL